MFNNTAYVPPVVKAAVQGYGYKGCYVDGAPRVLAGYVGVSEKMTQETCVATCKGRGYAVAGVEYGKECWCGSGVPKVKAPEGECSMRCAGDESQSCGGGFRLNVWAL